MGLRAGRCAASTKHTALQVAAVATEVRLAVTRWVVAILAGGPLEAGTGVPMSARTTVRTGPNGARQDGTDEAPGGRAEA